MAVLTNAILFQLTWFGCVLGGARGEPWWGILPLSLLMAFVARRPYIRQDLALTAVLVSAGWGLEFLWIQKGVLVYVQANEVFPVWILLLWGGVALTINHSLAWFHRFPVTGAALAAVAAPLCYLSGAQLGAVVVPEPLGLIWVSTTWFAVFFVVFRFMAVHGSRSTPVVFLGR